MKWERLFQNTLDFNIQHFRLNWFLSLIITDKKKWCPGFGWENDEMALAITSTTIMQDFYKEMVKRLCTLNPFKIFVNEAWMGYEAKYIDQCSSSQYVTAGV